MQEKFLAGRFTSASIKKCSGKLSIAGISLQSDWHIYMCQLLFFKIIIGRGTQKGGHSLICGGHAIKLNCPFSIKNLGGSVPLLNKQLHTPQN